MYLNHNCDSCYGFILRNWVLWILRVWLQARTPIDGWVLGQGSGLRGCQDWASRSLGVATGRGQRCSAQALLAQTTLQSCQASHVVMAPLPADFGYGEWSAVYNSLSFGIAAMGSATIFFWLQLPNVSKSYRTALTVTGLVTLIATYHYIRIFNSWVAAFDVANKDGGDYQVQLTGTPFNDAYRYVDWLLTVPLLLIELILVMKLPADQTTSLSWKLGLASALMVALGYPGEIQDDLMVRWFWWALAMVPFCYVVYELVVGLKEATSKQPSETAANLVSYARYLTVISWCTYPVVYIVKNIGLAGPTATMYEQVGYSVADVMAKAVFGTLIWAIAAEKSSVEESGKLLP